MQKLNDLSRSLAPLEPDGTLIAVIEMSQSSWLVAGIVPGVERQPLKKLAADEIALLKLLHRWREEAEKAGRRIERTAVAFEAGRDGFWLARWLRKLMIVALARKLLIALWRLVREGVVPDGVVLRPTR
jgi:transposase